MIDESRYVVQEGSGDLKISNLDGVRFTEAPIPRRWHRCWVQTKGWVTEYAHIARCACGAVSLNGSAWGEKNARRKW